MQHFRGHIQTKNGHTCRKRRSNFTCTRPAEARALILMCAQQVLTQTRQKRRLDSMCSISRTEGVSRVLSSTRRTAAADAHMQSWMAVMLDQKRPKTAVRFDVHISSETKTRAVTCFYARNDGPFSHVHASPAGNRTNYMRATHAPR